MKLGFKRSWGSLLSWPKPPGAQRQVACHFCDTLHHAPHLKEGMAARCIRCDCVIYQNRPASLVRASAFSLTALILMALAQCFPFLSMSAAGINRELTLVNAASSLMQADAPILGVSVVLFTIVCPLVMVCGMLYSCFPLLFGHAPPFAFYVVKWMYRSEPWNMVEVFLLGVLVSLLKLAKVADIHFGIGFWAFAGVMLCLAGAIAGIDRQELWDRLEVAQK